MAFWDDIKDTLAGSANSGGFWSGMTSEAPTTVPAETPSNIFTLKTGGSYNRDFANTGTPDERGYAGLAPQTGFERNHIIPVSLGGTSERSNLEYQGKDEADYRDNVEKYVAREYKNGNMDLNEARGKVLGWRNEDIPGQPAYEKRLGGEQNVATQWFNSLPEEFSHLGQRFAGILGGFVGMTPEESKDLGTWKDLASEISHGTMEVIKSAFNHPSDFADNAINGVMQGLSDFFGNPLKGQEPPEPQNPVFQGFKLAGGAAPYLAAGAAGEVLGGATATGKAIGNVAGFVGLGQAELPANATIQERIDRATNDAIGLLLFSVGEKAVGKTFEKGGEIYDTVKDKVTEAQKIQGQQAGMINPKGMWEDIKQNPQVTKLRDTLYKAVDTIDPATGAIREAGQDPYAGAMKAIHTPEAEAVSFDRKFADLEKSFSKYTPKELDNFNLTRGTPGTAEGIRLAEEAKTGIPLELRDPKLVDSIKEVSDHVFKYAQESGVKMDYFKDYFYGTYKNPEKVNAFMDYWKSTDKFTKEKVFPTIADARAFGLELKTNNPITNIKQELFAVAKNVGLTHLREEILNKWETAGNLTERLSSIQKKEWKPINDPVFKGMQFEPRFAKLMNNLISTNKFSQYSGLKAIRQIAYSFQQAKFALSGFHMFNMFKASLSQEAGAIFRPKGWVDFAKSFKAIDEAHPMYKEYVGLGGGHSASLELEISGQMNRFLQKIGLGKIADFYPQTLMMEKYIPSLKFNKYISDVINKEHSLGRELTDYEKIDIIKRNQNFYGEMNEKLFGRSGTATSALRLLFTAPGYGEGNFRQIFRGVKGDTGSLKFMVNSLISTAVLSTIGTYIMTGKLPPTPQKLRDVRDLFKVRTNITDGKGDRVYYDLLTYEKDYGIFGNLALGNVGEAGQGAKSRFANAVSTPAKVLSDLSIFALNGTVHDFKDKPVYYKSDSSLTQFGKLLEYEAVQSLPITASTYGQYRQKGISIDEATILSIAGIKPTTSESVKEAKSAQQDLFSMQTEKKNKQLELNKLYNENADEAVKEAHDFNETMKERLFKIYKERGYTDIPTKEYYKYIIKNLHPSKSGTRIFQGE